MMAGCYELAMYCDARTFDDRGMDTNPNHERDEFPHEFFANTEAQAHRVARSIGWLISAKRQLCPKCSGKRKAAHT